MPKRINLNQAWTFEKGINDKQQFDPATVDLPHTWNAIDGANGFDFYRAKSRYQKTFTLAEQDQGRRIYIECEGANSVTEVFVNGMNVGKHEGGYSTFRFDVTDVVSFTEANTLIFEVDNRHREDIYPLMADFTFYGGIYRDVNLVVTDVVHFDLLDHGSNGVYLFQEDVSDESATVRLDARLVNETDKTSEARLWIDVTDQVGQSVYSRGKEVTLTAGVTTEVVKFTIDDPILWHGVKDPHLYLICVKLEIFNDTVDEVVLPLGLRYYHVDPETGFFLNGESYPLRGVSRHQDRKDMGWAITEAEHDEDMAFIREVGANTIRLAHYQHDQYFYDLCDQYGIVTWAETPFISRVSKTDVTGKNAKSQMIELIRQNLHHPSICFWGIQNEIQIGGDKQAVRDLVHDLNVLTKQEDPTRLTTMANVMFVENADTYNQETDLIGYNKYYGWYVGEAEEFAPFLDSFHKDNPNVPIGISEYGAEGIIRYHNTDPKVKDYTEDYHALYHEKVYKIFHERPFLWSTFVWNMFDFGANIRDEGGVKGRNNKGLITYDRKIKKDAFYLYQAYWREDPVVHLTGKRYVNREGDVTQFKVYTNEDTVTLYVNGKKLATQHQEDRAVVFTDVVLTDGENKVMVVSNSGKTDTGYFDKVATFDPRYKAPVKDEGGLVANWFDMPDDEIDETPLEDVVITDDVFSTRDTFERLVANEKTREILFNQLGDVTKAPMYEMMSTMKVDTLASMDSDTLSPRVLNKLNQALTKVKK